MVSPLAGMVDAIEILVRRGASPTELGVALRTLRLELQDVEERAKAGRDAARLDDVKPCDLTRVVERVVAAGTSRRARAHVELRLDIDPALRGLHVPVRGGHINYATTALLDNAVDALAGRSSRVIGVSVGRDGADIVVAVEDDGPGIPLEVQAVLLRERKTTKPNGGGTALYLTGRWLAGDGASLTLVRSVPGCTRFEIRVPGVYDVNG
jgi:signal transduction histidine kinase